MLSFLFRVLEDQLRLTRIDKKHSLGTGAFNNRHKNAREAGRDHSSGGFAGSRCQRLAFCDAILPTAQLAGAADKEKTFYGLTVT